MELYHFRYFIAVAEDLSFTKAAKRLGMAQPPLSRQIRALESEIGVQLFERRSGRVFLTDAGRGLLNGARSVLEQVATAVDIARQAKNGELGAVRVGFGKGLGDIVSLVINQHMRLSPNIEMDVKSILSGHQGEALTNRKIDIGFMHGPATALGLGSEALLKESLSVVLARSNPLAKRAYLRLSDLRAETLLLIDRAMSPHAHDLTLTLFRNAGVNPKIITIETTCYDEEGAMLMASGKGVTLAVGRNPTYPSFADQLIALPLREPQATLEVHVAWRIGESSPTILKFIDTARMLLQPYSRVTDIQNLPRIVRRMDSPAGQRRKRGGVR
jgi:DNA-binding transcriptional LysR family regulator